MAVPREYPRFTDYQPPRQPSQRLYAVAEVGELPMGTVGTPELDEIPEWDVHSEVQTAVRQDELGQQDDRPSVGQEMLDRGEVDELPSDYRRPPRIGRVGPWSDMPGMVERPVEVTDEYGATRVEVQTFFMPPPNYRRSYRQSERVNGGSKLPNPELAATLPEVAAAPPEVAPAGIDGGAELPGQPATGSELAAYIGAAVELPVAPEELHGDGAENLEISESTEGQAEFHDPAAALVFPPEPVREAGETSEAAVPTDAPAEATEVQAGSDGQELEPYAGAATTTQEVERPGDGSEHTPEAAAESAENPTDAAVDIPTETPAGEAEVAMPSDGATEVSEADKHEVDPINDQGDRAESDNPPAEAPNASDVPDEVSIESKIETDLKPADGSEADAASDHPESEATDKPNEESAEPLEPTEITGANGEPVRPEEVSTPPEASEQPSQREPYEADVKLGRMMPDGTFVPEADYQRQQAEHEQRLRHEGIRIIHETLRTAQQQGDLPPVEQWPPILRIFGQEPYAQTPRPGTDRPQERPDPLTGDGYAGPTADGGFEFQGKRYRTIDEMPSEVLEKLKEKLGAWTARAHDARVRRDAYKERREARKEGARPGTRSDTTNPQQGQRRKWRERKYHPEPSWRRRLLTDFLPSMAMSVPIAGYSMLTAHVNKKSVRKDEALPFTWHMNVAANGRSHPVTVHALTRSGAIRRAKRVAGRK
ncbi:MAG TPA: hypothetical protein VJP80_04310 [Candidatus Saccharimonadales bacterium]|nr:hypothetical protein [Candidatus Saccharimonadales bacterium]